MADINEENPMHGTEGHVHEEGEEHEMSEEEEFAHMIECFRKAGAQTAKIASVAQKLVLPGETALDIAESLEKMMIDDGFRPGFPVNISINDIAAHFTPEHGSVLIIGERDLVKVDLGVQVDGCCGDTAVSIDLSGEYGKMLEASQAALDTAIAAIRPGKKNGAIGAEIEHEITSRGFKPIENLTGHKIEPYLLHAGVGIPNTKTTASYEFQEGDIFAIEPFATNGAGMVIDTPQVEIFSARSAAKVRLPQSRQLLSFAVENFLTLPFAQRWIEPLFNSKIALNAALKELLNSGALHPYPVLREAKRGIVAQFEHSVLITHDGCEVLTKR
jgi:methionyl aminopeptidase